MKKSCAVIFTVIGLFTVHLASAGEKGNGGGLVERHGKYLSFKSAGVKVNLSLQELTERELPELTNFETKIDQVILPTDVRYALMNAERPSATRKYYRAKLSDLPSTEIAKVMSAYKKSVNPNFSGKIVLAAITKGLETYLFDPYFAITRVNSRLAILLHEAAWVISPNSSYSDVIKTEEDFESCLEKVNSIPPSQKILCNQWINSLSKVYREPALLLRTLAYDDYSNGRLESILNEYRELPVSFIFAPEIMKSNITELYIKLDPSYKDRSLMNGIQYDYLKTLILKYPEITFLPELLRWSDRLYLTTDSELWDSAFEKILGNDGIRLWDTPIRCWDGPQCDWDNPRPDWRVTHQINQDSFGDRNWFVGISTDQ